MDTVTILRQLWRLRLLVVAVGVLSILVGFVVSFKLTYPLESRKYTVGVASARILVDTPNSQVVEVAPEGSDAVGARATLLSNLMVDGEIKAEIAKRASLRPEDLYGVGETATGPGAAEPPGRDDYVLSTEVLAIPNGGWLPIIEVSTQAPDVAGAQKLANAAVQGLTEFLDSKAAADAVPNADRLRVGGLGPAQVREATRGPRLLMSVAAILFTFIAGCAMILGIAAIVRGLRAGETPPAEPRPEPPVATRGDERSTNEAEGAWEADLPGPERATTGEEDADEADSTPREPTHPSASAGGSSAWWVGGPSS